MDADFAHLLSEDEATFVRHHVPWTRKLEERRVAWRDREVDLIPHVLRHRHELVLKPSHDYGGRSVHMGEELAASAWQAAVEEGMGRPWVVQERVSIPEESFPIVEGDHLRFDVLKANTNPFYVTGADVGAVTRVLSQLGDQRERRGRERPDLRSGLSVGTSRPPQAASLRFLVYIRARSAGEEKG